jgi:hypothetical protein
METHVKVENRLKELEINRGDQVVLHVEMTQVFKSIEGMFINISQLPIFYDQCFKSPQTPKSCREESLKVISR